GIQEGDSAPIDTLLAIIGEEGEDISALLNGSSSEKSETTKATDPKVETEVKSEAAPVDDKKDAPVDDKKESRSESATIPEGVEIVKMPRLSDTMEEGTVA